MLRVFHKLGNVSKKASTVISCLESALFHGIEQTQDAFAPQIRTFHKTYGLV